jgi:hypothetical protein
MALLPRRTNMLGRIVFIGFAVLCFSACSSNNIEPKDLQQHINSGEAVLNIKINQPLVINSSESVDAPLRVNLGRKSRQSTKIKFFTNQVQHHISFAKAGEYALTVSSHPATGNAPNTLSLPVAVKVN